MRIRRGDIYVANLNPTVGSEIQKTRPVVVVSNNINNEFSGTVTILPITALNLNKLYPFEVLLPKITGLQKSSKAKADQIRTIDKSRLTQHLGRLDKEVLRRINEAIRIHLEL